MFEAAFKDAAQTIPAIPKYKSATLRGEMIETASAKKRKSRASEKIMK